MSAQLSKLLAFSMQPRCGRTAFASMVLCFGFEAVQGTRVLAQQNPIMQTCLRDADPERRVAACTHVIDGAHDLRVAMRARNAQGLALCDANRCSDAVDNFAQVVRAFPSVAGYLDNYSRALRWAKRYGEAVAASEKAIKLAPGQPFAYLGKARALEASGQLVEALQAVDRAEQLAPVRFGILGYRGKILGELGRYSEAEAAFAMALAEAARANAPAPASIFEERADVELAQGRTEAAILDLERYPTNGSDAEQVDEKLRALRVAPADNKASCAAAIGCNGHDRDSNDPPDRKPAADSASPPTKCNFYSWTPVQRCIEEYHTNNDPMPGGDPNPRRWNDELAAEGKALAERYPNVQWDHAAWNAMVVKNVEDAASERAELEYHKDAPSPADSSGPKPIKDSSIATGTTTPSADGEIAKCDAPWVLDYLKRSAFTDEKKLVLALRGTPLNNDAAITGIVQEGYDATGEHRRCTATLTVTSPVGYGSQPTKVSVTLHYHVDRRLDGDRGSWATCDNCNRV